MTRCETHDQDMVNCRRGQITDPCRAVGNACCWGYDKPGGCEFWGKDLEGVAFGLLGPSVETEFTEPGSG